MKKLFWSAAEYDYCVQICPPKKQKQNCTKEENKPESDSTKLNGAGLKTPLSPSNWTLVCLIYGVNSMVMILALKSIIKSICWLKCQRSDLTSDAVTDLRAAPVVELKNTKFVLTVALQERSLKSKGFILLGEWIWSIHFMEIRSVVVETQNHILGQSVGWIHLLHHQIIIFIIYLLFFPIV